MFWIINVSIDFRLERARMFSSQKSSVYHLKTKNMVFSSKKQQITNSAGFNITTSLISSLCLVIKQTFPLTFISTSDKPPRIIFGKHKVFSKIQNLTDWHWLDGFMFVQSLAAKAFERTQPIEKYRQGFVRLERPRHSLIKPQGFPLLWIKATFFLLWVCSEALSFI